MESQAFRELIVAETDAVYRMAYHLARNGDDAADLVQETYLRALKGEKGFELRDGGVRPWLFKIRLPTTFSTRRPPANWTTPRPPGIWRAWTGSRWTIG